MQTMLEGDGMKLMVSLSLGFRCLQYDAGMGWLAASVKCVWLGPEDEATHVICVRVGKRGVNPDCCGR